MQSMTLAGGRQFSWTTWGPKNGKPLLFCTGAGMDGSLGFGFDCIDELNVRLIAPDRPGLGESTMHENKTLSTWCDDIKELVQHLSLPTLHVIGFSQGAPFAFALSKIANAIAIVAGQDDFSHPATKALLPAETASFVSMVQEKNPQLLSGLAASADADGFFQMICSMSSEIDRELYESEPFRSAYQQSLRAGFKQGAGGYIGDLVNAMGPWPFQLEEIGTPIDLWYGALDTSPVHSPDFGTTLAKRLPRCRHNVLQKEGGSLLWTQSKRIITELFEH